MIHYYLQINNHPILQTPILGAGHSLGGNVIFGSSTINTKMFKALISIDGVISHPFDVGLDAFKLPVASYLRQDVWPSRKEAAKRLRKNEFYKNWTDQVFEQYVRYGLRDLPTLQYPQDSSIDKNVPVTLTCPAHNEVTTFVNLPKPDSEFGPGSLTSSAPLVLNSPYSCLVAMQHTSTPTHMILTDIGRSSFSLYKKVYKSEPNVNENITFSCLDESKTHSVPFEDPHLVAQIMADFAAPTLQKAVEQQHRYDNEVERYYGFHPIQHQRLGPLAKRFKDKKKKLKEKL